MVAPGLRRSMAQAIHLREGTPAPGVGAPAFVADDLVEALGVSRTLLISAVIGIVQRPVARKVVDGLPDRTFEEVAAARRHDLAHQIPAAAVGQGRDGGHAAALQDDFQRRDRVLHRDLQPVDRHTAAPPFCVHVGFVVELEIAHAGPDQGIEIDQFLDAQPAGIGVRPVDAHDGHDALGQEELGEIQRAVVVENLDPLDAHGLEFGQPEFPDLAHAHRGRVPHGPVDADAGIVGGTRIVAYVHNEFEVS